MKYLRFALDLVAREDPRATNVVARLAVAYATLPDEAAALDAGRRAATQLAQQKGGDAAAAYVSGLASILFEGGWHDAAFELARDGLGFAPTPDSLAWASLAALDAMRIQLDDPQFPGILLDIPERRTLGPIFVRAMQGQDRYDGYASAMYAQALIAYDSRAELEGLPLWRPLSVGNYRAELTPLRDDARRNEAAGRIGRAAGLWANLARLQTALGALHDAQEAQTRSAALIGRLPSPSHDSAVFATAIDEWRMATDEDWDTPIEKGGPGFGRGAVLRWYRAAVLAAQARIHARTGRVDRALHHLSSVIPAIERAPCWAANYVKIVSDAVETLWLTRRTEFLDAVEVAVRQKVISSDLRYPMADGRLSLARLCALTDRCEEAAAWFAKARAVLDEQGARPLRAITDYDEALMYCRRGDAGDGERARPLLDVALAQFRTIGMPGWIRRAEALGQELSSGTTAPAAAVAPPASPVPTARASLRAEGDYWTIAYDGRTVRLQHSRGLVLLARLLRAPGREIAATELVAGVDGEGASDTQVASSTRATLGDAGELLDAPARAAYKRRVDELRGELAEAEACNDPGRAERLRAELDVLTAELARAVGLGGRARRAGSHAERARVNATRTLALALRKIAAQHPALGEHFARTIRTGTFCSYAPDPRAPIDWDV